ncbi:class I lanthipeptide [Pedobacter sp. 22163]|uniref:class I lanthipeptide n=1 Tax=Pedobacter sp. 22163 TaxID=3453883 RepID=UPI003F870757
MKKKKLTLNKLTLGYLTDIEQKNVVGGDIGGASNLYVNTVCATPTTYKPSSYLATCPLTATPVESCRTIPYKTCAPA